MTEYCTSTEASTKQPNSSRCQTLARNSVYFQCLSGPNTYLNKDNLFRLRYPLSSANFPPAEWDTEEVKIFEYLKDKPFKLADMECYTLPTPAYPAELCEITLTLWTDLANASKLRQRLIDASIMQGPEGTAERKNLDFAFLDGNMVCPVTSLAK